jgi:uncharacterized FAD-dependent dehydrogenase
MIRIAEIKLPLSEAAAPEPALRAAACAALGLVPADIGTLSVFKRSFDARKAELLAVYIVDLSLADPTAEAPLLARLADRPHISATPDMTWRAPVQAPADLPLRPVVIGFGPCGIFAALTLAQMGFRPIVLERGKPVRERTKDTWGLWRKQTLHPESNVQFGEGGAGTFSDGKPEQGPAPPGPQGHDRVCQGRCTRRNFVRRPPPHRYLQAGQGCGAHARTNHCPGR